MEIFNILYNKTVFTITALTVAIVIIPRWRGQGVESLVM